jgi:hypothetical protein
VDHLFFLNYFCESVYVLLGIKPRVFYMLGKYSTDLHSQLSVRTVAEKDTV